MWKTEKVPMNEKTLVWIKDKVDSTKEGQIIIEIRDKEAIAIHYFSKQNFVDIDKETKE